MLTNNAGAVYITTLHNGTEHLFVKHSLLQIQLNSAGTTAASCQLFTTSRAAAKQLAFPARTPKQLARTAASLYILGPWTAD